MENRAHESIEAGVEDRHVADRMSLTADVVASYISTHSVRPDDLAELISSVHRALARLGKPCGPFIERGQRPTPAQIRASITPDGLISFLDGKPYKTLKRHLWGNGLDPRSYRTRFGLPSDYPMVSPNYSIQRSALAKSLGLGRSGKSTDQEPTVSV
ncbi:MucR family transcriptional regulator [uncultured Methylobacterium sp.]|uniref:MucR family transcriptional regulator n=1 Tax=uncultured Methylobacterium sp. TaxID=157278 RepID=UPI0035C9F13B